MNYEKEIERRDKRIESFRAELCELKEENTALRQLVQCAAANIALLVKEGGKCVTLSKEDVKEALSLYKLTAHRNKRGDYVLEIESREEKNNEKSDT